jgi:hypothetical protein
MLRVRQRGARRVRAFDTRGEALANFYVQSGLFTERSLSCDSNGNLRVRVFVGVSESPKRWPWPIGQLVYAVDGRLIDSILPPCLADEPIGIPGVFGASKVWDMRGDLAVVGINGSHRDSTPQACDPECAHWIRLEHLGTAGDVTDAGGS